MRELSLNVLDVAQNSIVAEASLIEIDVTQSRAADRLTIVIADNGRGMSAEQAQSALDPFYTTRTTRDIGMGIPLFKMAAEMAGGSFLLHSEQGVGTQVTAVFQLSHIDCVPLGDMAGTVETLIRLNASLDFVFRYVTDDGEGVLDTRELREQLEDVPLNEPDVMLWIRECLAEMTTDSI